MEMSEYLPLLGIGTQIGTVGHPATFFAAFQKIRRNTSVHCINTR
jgi:hypothetical protein